MNYYLIIAFVKQIKSKTNGTNQIKKNPSR